VAFHGAHRYEQRLRDLRVRQMLADQREDLRLAGRYVGASCPHALSVPNESRRSYPRRWRGFTR